MTGRVVQDLTLKKTANSQYCRFRIAVDRRLKRNESDYFTCVIWGKGAEALVNHSYKGAKISISGSLVTSEYVDQNDVKRIDYEIVVQDFDILDFKTKEMKPSLSQEAHEISQQPDISQISTDDLEDMGLPFEF
jgi:single-strand DNA-binding protein